MMSDRVIHLIAYAFMAAAFSFIALNAESYAVTRALPATLAAIAIGLMVRTAFGMRRQRKPAAWELWNEKPRQDVLPPS